MAAFVKGKDCFFSRLKSLTRIQRFKHSLQPEVDSDSVTHHVDVSKWKKVDARIFGITRFKIPQASWIVLKILRGEGFQAYLVGGCVRDLILNKVPKDFDVITTANLKEIKKQFHRAVIIGLRFPICQVHVKGSIIEVSSFETVARHEETKRVSICQKPHGCDDKDFALWRNSLGRDFTVNSLFFDPFRNKIYDYADGMADLKSLKLRTLIPAYQSFKEDCARILRGLRIAARLGLSFSKETETAMRQLASSVEKLGKNRMMLELNYMLSYGAAESSVSLLRRFNLLEFFLPFHAAYFEQQASRTPAPSCIMLMKLLFNLDKLVSCERPADCSLWVGLLAFHQALVCNPQDAFVIWVFASVLYHGKWQEGLEFARKHAKEQARFVLEVCGFSQNKSDEELAEDVTQLATLVQDCAKAFTNKESGLVFLSRKVAKDVEQILDVLLYNIESYNEGRKSFFVDYYLLGKGNPNETRFVLGKIILETLNGEIVVESEVGQKKENPAQSEINEDDGQQYLSDFIKNQCLDKTSRKRPPTSESKLEGAKKQKNGDKNGKMVTKKEVAEACRKPEEEYGTENKQEGFENDEYSDEPRKHVKELENIGSGKSQGKPKKKKLPTAIQKSNLTLNKGIKKEDRLEEKDCGSLQHDKTCKKIGKNRAVKENGNRLQLSSLFK